MDMTPPGVATIAGDAEVDHAIATLVLAFVTDPVARWMYDVPDRYLLHIPRLFRALGKPSFEGGGAQRTDDGLGVALWLPPGVHGDDGPVEAVIAESIVEEKQAEVARRIRADGTLSAIRAPVVSVINRGRSLASEQGPWCGAAGTPPSAMRSATPPGIPVVLEPT
jgi:hypothetical protein